MKKLISMICLVAATLTASANEWIDVTSIYLTNPNFDGSASGWNNSVSRYQNGGYQSAWYSNGDVWISNFMEVWLPTASGTLGAGSLYQTVSLPAGQYRLEADCIATKQAGSSSWWGGGGTAGSSNVAGVSLYAQPVGGSVYSTSITTADGVPQHFTNEFTLDKDGQVDLGILLGSNCEANWVAMDNYLLYTYTEFQELLGLSLDKTSVDLEVGDSYQLTVGYVPSNATYKSCTWSTSDGSVATVDAQGNVKAVGVGKAEITVTGYGGSVSATCTINVTYTAPSAAALIINEIQVSNCDMFLDPSFNYGSWIEIYNGTNDDASLGYLYISDDPANLKKFHMRGDFGSVSAHGYKNIWFDHNGIWNVGELNQVNFKLNYEGGTIYISDGVNILAQQTYPAAMPRTSYARTSDGGTEWGISADPTPEATNNSMTFATEQLADPTVNYDGRIYSGSLTISVTKPSGSTLRYTTDGSVPTLTNGSTSSTGIFVVTNATKVYRFRTFKDGYIPSNVVTRTYIYNTGSLQLPVVSVVTDNDNINSTEFGLYKQGENGRPGNGQSTKCNWNMDWDRPVNFEYFDIDESGAYEMKLNQQVDMAMCGGWSRAWTPHSFKLKASKLYEGKNTMDYQFFDNKPYLKHKTLQLRNGGNDTGCRLKDAALQECVRRSGLYIESQSWQPAVIYLNGVSQGVLNIREPNNKHYAYANYGIDTDIMDQFEISPDSGYVQMAGTKDSFNRIYELAQSAGEESSYQELCNLIDMDEYVNYMAVEFYLGGFDWPQNNVKGFRDQQDGKFHFVLFDLDGAFTTTSSFSAFANKAYYTFDNLYGTDALGHVYTGTRITKENEFVTIFENMLQNSTFRKKFVDAFCLIAGSVFEPTRCRDIINEMVTVMAKGGVSASSTGNSVISSLSSSRQTTMVSMLQNDGTDFGVSSISPQTVSLSSNATDAHLLVNGMQVPTDKFSGQLFSPITLTAVAPAGYRFLGWAGDITSTGTDYTLFDKGSAWNYYDQGSLDSEDWTATSYNASWSAGNSPIGYGKSTVSTSMTSNLLTYYLRKTVNLSEAPSANDAFTINYTIDDGFVIYVNGTEAGRYNMPSGQQGYSVAASTYANGNPDTGTMTLPTNLFKKGNNVIAVEIHNNQTSSSDILWDAQLIQTKVSEGDATYVSTDSIFTMPSSGSVSLKAMYEKIADDELIAQGTTPVKVNEISAENGIYVDDYFKKDDWVELYNTTDNDIDVAGMYISDDESQPQKFQIPGNDIQQTIIPSHGNLVVWASKRDNFGSQIHTNFKLSNDDGEKVILTAEDGTWCDTFTYNAHGEKETVGLYPDGGNATYRMAIPSIGNANKLTSDAAFLWNNAPAEKEEPQEQFTLNLIEGWNWISQPLDRSIAVNEVNTNALRFVSQTAETMYDESLGWTGSLSSLNNTSAYKVQMAQDFSTSFDGPFTSTRSITLRKGWNWIGYPVTVKQNVADALSTYRATEGDRLVGYHGFSTYEDGEWWGTLQVMEPGEGYLFKSSAAKTLTYSAPSATESGAKARATFRSQPRRVWTAVSGKYPNVMSVVGKVVDNTSVDATPQYTIAAFDENDECRGVGEYVNNLVCFSIQGNGGEKISFKAEDPSTGVIYDIKESYTFDSDAHGTRKAPETLTIGDAAGINAVNASADIEDVSYFTLDGQRTSQLGNGVTVAKYRLSNGMVISKKIIK